MNWRSKSAELCDTDATDAVDERLGARLRDLALVDLTALLSGLEQPRREELAQTYAADVQHALRATQRRCQQLIEAIQGQQPLLLANADSAARLRSGGHDIGERAIQSLEVRARAAAQLARLDQLALAVVPRLLEADRLRGPA